MTQRLSDLLLLGSTSVIPHWNFDGSLQYSPGISRSMRSIVGVRWQPGPFRTLSTTYRFTRGLSEQLEVGWQWPLRWPYGAATPVEAVEASRSEASRRRRSGSSCTGSWYGVGRFNYSTLERRVTDSIVGLEYDAGCWIGARRRESPVHGPERSDLAAAAAARARGVVQRLGHEPARRS